MPLLAIAFLIRLSSTARRAPRCFTSRSVRSRDQFVESCTGDTWLSVSLPRSSSGRRSHPKPWRSREAAPASPPRVWRTPVPRDEPHQAETAGRAGRPRSRPRPGRRLRSCAGLFDFTPPDASALPAEYVPARLPKPIPTRPVREPGSAESCGRSPGVARRAIDCRAPIRARPR